MIPLRVAAAALALAAPGMAQPRVASAATLSVAAESRVARPPDVADLSAGVITQATTATEALRLNARRMATVIAALKRAGIADRDIQTSNLSVNPQYVYRDSQPPQLTGYQAVNNISARVRDLANIGRTIDVLVAQGANQIGGPAFRLDEPDIALDEARVAALAKARHRAELYAKAMGLRVRRIAHLSETGGMIPPPYPVPNARIESMAVKDVSTPIAQGEVEASITVNVTFDLE